MTKFEAGRTWRNKAEGIISRYSLESYRQANILQNGQKRKRHVPYSIPEIATALVEALAHDDKREAKRLFQVEASGSWSMI